MKDFYEAILTIETGPHLAGAYKKAIEDENSRYWIHNEVKDSKGDLIKEENKPVWNGNHCHVEIEQRQAVNGIKGGSLVRESAKAILTITLISHTIPNLKSTVDWYEKMGAEVVYKSWESGNNG